MPVTYAQTLTPEMILTEVETLLAWRGQVVRQCFFPAEQKQPADAHAPSVLLMWCRRAAESGKIGRQQIEGVVAVHEELCKAAQKMLSHGGPPPPDLYDAFENQFEGFIARLRHLQQEVADSGLSVDPVTGLRTASGMMDDLRREQDRYDRKGPPFSLAAIGIDRLPELEQRHDRRAMDAIVQSVAQAVARTVRSFDDAYVTGRGEFLLVLKNIGFEDACAVMDRLRAEVAGMPVFLPGGDKIRVTASFGLAEALQKEEVALSLRNAQRALVQARDAGGNRVFEFRETSALEQFAKDTGRKP